MILKAFFQIFVVATLLPALYRVVPANLWAQSNSDPIKTSLEHTEFSSWDEAIRYVRRNYVSETTNTSRSSWINGLDYYDAEGKGYLIINMKGKEYIFRGVPRQTWNEFKEAESLGRYYYQHIKGRYYFSLQGRRYDD